MTIATLARLAVAAGVLTASVSSAYAYTIHYKDGRYSVTCENGDRWTRGNGTQQISHADAANICAKRGSAIIDSSGAGGSGPVKGAKKSVQAIHKAN